MMGCNSDITVWIRKRVPEINKEIFVKRVLPVKCKWRNYTEREINGGTANIYNHVVIVIPYFDKLNEFNIKEGDLAALGVWDIEITGISPYTIGEVRQLLAPNIMIIKTAARNFDLNNNDDMNNINDMNNMRGKHLRVTGV